jgi:aspartate racemase
MKHIGIVAVSMGGAALCYRTICLEGPDLLGPYAHPEISLHNFPLSAYQRLIDLDDWGAVGEMLLESAKKLVRAGAHLLICPDNTIHQGLDLVREHSPAPWIHPQEIPPAIDRQTAFVFLECFFTVVCDLEAFATYQ